MEAIELSVNQSKTGLNLLKKQLKFVEKQLTEIDKELEQLIDNDEDVNNSIYIALYLCPFSEKVQQKLSRTLRTIICQREG